MNLILLDKNELDDSGFVSLSDRRAKHICEVIKPAIGERLNAGIINGKVGQVEVLDFNTGSSPNISLQILNDTFKEDSPPAIDISLIIALPRPKVARRLIALCTECGVKDIHFINSYRVEKSFWQSPLLSDEKVYQQIKLSLEQAKDTQRPNIQFHKRFKPFVEDELPSLAKDKQALVAHPYDADVYIDEQTKTIKQAPRLMVIGPEGGFIPYEIELLKKAGLKTLGLGSRIYRVETVVPLLLGKLT